MKYALRLAFVCFFVQSISFIPNVAAAPKKTIRVCWPIDGSGLPCSTPIPKKCECIIRDDFDSIITAISAQNIDEKSVPLSINIDGISSGKAEESFRALQKLESPK